MPVSDAMLTRWISEHSNVTQRVSTISRDLAGLETYKPFGSEPVSTFIRNFERFIEPYDLSDSEKRKFILRKLSNPALRVVEDCIDYEETKARLLEEFEPS